MSARSETGAVAVPHDELKGVVSATSEMDLREKIACIEGLRREVKNVVAGLRSIIAALSSKSDQLSLKNLGPLQDEGEKRTIEATAILARVKANLEAVRETFRKEESLKSPATCLIREAKEVGELRQQLSIVYHTVFKNIGQKVEKDLRAMEMAQ